MPNRDRLAVWVGDEHVAELERRRGGDLELVYRPEVLSGHGVNAIVLSIALPTSPRPYRGDPVIWWANGVLPEGEARTVLEDRFSIRRGDTFALLGAIGRECAGAVAFLRDGEVPAETEAPVPVSDDELVDAVASLPRRPLGAAEDVPVSLAGLQHKLLMVRTEAGWARPGRGRLSTHILKPDPFEFPGLVVAEALTMTAARQAGLDVAEVALERIGDRDVLVVTRFDRRVDRGTVKRVHQEDGCQALGIDASRDLKYQRVGRPLPSYEALAKLLLDHAADPAAEQANLARAMVLAVAAGNTDGHARNHGFLIEGGVARFAPIYDVAPTIEFSRSKRMAMWVSGQDQLEEVSRHHLRAEASAWVPLRRDAAELVTATAARLADAFGEASSSFPTVPAVVVDRMQRRARRLAG